MKCEKKIQIELHALAYDETASKQNMCVCVPSTSAIEKVFNEHVLRV